MDGDRKLPGRGVEEPKTKDRWQNRSNDRVAVVESVRTLGDATVVFYRYEQRTPNARSTKLQQADRSRFVVEFSLFEAAAECGDEASR